jgi:hypothetical protein
MAADRVAFPAGDIRLRHCDMTTFDIAGVAATVAPASI